VRLISAPICGLAIVLVTLLPASAADLPAGLAEDGTGRVVEVIDGDTVRLDDGVEVRLVGLQAPKLPLGRPDFPVWPLAEEARAALETLLLGESVTLAYGGRRIDRHGRRLAHLFLADGTWVQAAVLSVGMARVYSFADNRAAVPDLLAFEGAARAAGRGIWADPWYAIRDVDGIEADLDSFQLVEGRVVSVARVGSRAYLNFGTDWKTDFTLTLDAGALATFDAEGFAVEALEGRRIRSRGWVEYFNGPMIEITHPEQIEVLDE
jgi:endonuclease YncB( thermonuclease family)